MFCKPGITLAITVMAMACADLASADLELCNNTSSRVGVALGYKDPQGWTSEGWWNIGPEACEVLLKDPLAARYYYIYAVDYDTGGSWGGEAMMCTRDKEFTIRGIEECEARGYRKSGFLEVDTGKEPNWSVSLSSKKTSPRSNQ